MRKRLHLDIGGMSCINCQNKIQKALNMTDGVIKATASYSNGTADIEYDEKKINKEQMVKIIEKLDYKVLGAGIGLSISRTIIQAHGGSIRCESTPGVGSRFIVTFDKNE